MSKYSSNLCTGGTAICNGYTSGYPAANAFDSDTSTYWESAETGSSVIGVSWIGYNFGKKVNIKKFNIYTDEVGGGSLGLEGHNESSVIISYSDNGSSWTTLETLSIATTSSSWITGTLSTKNNTPHQYWRIVANVTPWRVDSSTWMVHEIEMYSLLGGNSYIIGWLD